VLAVRRHTGGSAVYAEAGVLGLDVMLPTGHRLVLLDVVETYRWLGEIWRHSLQALGVTGRLVSIEEARQALDPLPRDAPLRLACFGTLSPYEVSAEGRKLVGLAQVRRRNGVLLQSAIHQHFDAGRVAVLLGMESSHALREAAIGLDELGDVSIYEVMGAFEDTLQRELAVVLRPGQWTDVETAYVTASEQPIPWAPDGSRS
jgi:lipoate-protein ligase A